MSISSPFYRDAIDEPLEPGFQPVELGAVEDDPPQLPPASPATPGAVCGRWSNAQHNGRLDRALPEGTWSVRWQTELQAGSRPVCLQQAGTRIVLQCEEDWELFDTSGAHIARGPVGPGELLVDPGLGLFYSQQHRAGAFQADRLEDGSRRFVHMLGWGEGFYRSFMATLSGNRLAVAGYHRKTNPHGPSPAISGMEVWALGEPVEADAVGILASAERRAVLHHESLCFLAAQDREGFVIAVENGVWRTDSGLNLQAGATGTFVPLHMSLDEAGRAHLIVDEAQRLQAYWLLSPEGELLARCPYPRETEGEVVAPPVLGYDRTTYLFTDLMVYALDGRGRELWRSEIGGRLGGGVVTGDDRLLVAAGESVSTLSLEDPEDADGDPQVVREPLVTLEAQRLRTAPILTADGHMLVATEGSLYCLAAS